ncbi:MAG: PASTA domain-containing protein [Solobacterium sp.]|nr:PASTA domain-containing protein [Solobacterium sp.]
MKRIITIIIASFLFLVGCSGGETRSSSDSSVNDTGKIEMIDVLNMELPKAKLALDKAGFTSVKSNYDNNNSWDETKLIVVEQNIQSGKKADPNDEIVLTCRKLCELYFDLESEYNLLFNKYDLDLYIDNQEIGSISNGQKFTKLVEVLEGEHTFTVYKAGGKSTKATKTINVSDHMTFKSKITHGGSISFENSELKYGVEGSSLEVIDVTNKILADAKNSLKSLGFVNVREEPYGDIWDDNNWIVTSQSVKAGEKIDKNKNIQLNCIKLDNYYNDAYSGKTLDVVQDMAAELGVSLKYRNSQDNKDLDETIGSLPDDSKEYWIVESAENWVTKTALLYLTYLGTPEEKAAAEAKEQLINELESNIPKENAKKAIVVAFTNNSSIDVFTDDGNYYDPAKLHGYDYNGEFKQTITKEGTWTALDNTTWHVENMYLLMKVYDQATKLSCNVTFDGNNYIVSNVNYKTATPKYIDTDDPQKTSGWMKMEPDEYYIFLKVPAELVTGNGGQNTVTETYYDAGTTKENTSTSMNSEYEDWVYSQFSSWDGSHKQLTKLIKKSLNDEKSYKHIDTKFYTATDQGMVDEFNKILSSSGYSDRMELNDILILTEFSAKNSFNATIKATAIGISSYKNQTIKLVGIE